MSFFFDSANRDNDDVDLNLNRPHKLIPTSLYPDHDYDAVRLSLADVSIPKKICALRVPGRNKLYVQNQVGERYIVTFDQAKEWTNAALADAISSDPNVQDMSQWTLPPGYESLRCSYDRDALTFTFSIVKDPHVWVVGDLPGYFRIDLSDYKGDSCHEQLGFPNLSRVPADQRYTAWMSYDPTLRPLPAGITDPVAGIVVTPLSEYPSSYYLRTSLPGTNIDCAYSRDAHGRDGSNVQTRRSHILARIMDANVEPGQVINLTASYPNQYSTTVYTKQMPDVVKFWLSDLEGNLASFRLDWTATFNLEFLQYAS